MNNTIRRNEGHKSHQGMVAKQHFLLINLHTHLKTSCQNCRYYILSQQDKPGPRPTQSTKYAVRHIEQELQERTRETSAAKNRSMSQACPLNNIEAGPGTPMEVFKEAEYFMFGARHGYVCPSTMFCVFSPGYLRSCGIQSLVPKLMVTQVWGNDVVYAICLCSCIYSSYLQITYNTWYNRNHVYIVVACHVQGRIIKGMDVQY